MPLRLSRLAVLGLKNIGVERGLSTAVMSRTVRSMTVWYGSVRPRTVWLRSDWLRVVQGIIHGLSQPINQTVRILGCEASIMLVCQQQVCTDDFQRSQIVRRDRLKQKHVNRHITSAPEAPELP